MSLINKMLSDLEQRHSHHKENEEIVIGGLAPVASTGFAEPRLPYNLLLVCFFIVAVCAAAYGYLTMQPGQVQPSVVEPPAVPEKVVRPGRLPHEFSLRMDMALPLPLPVKAGSDEQSLPMTDKPLPALESLPVPDPVELDPVALLDLTPAEAQMPAHDAEYGRMEIRPASPQHVPLAGQRLRDAKIEYQQGRYDAADHNMLALLKEDPLNRDARTLYATSLIQRGNPADAARILASGLELNSAVPEWAMLYAKILTDQGKVAEAAGVLEKSLPSIDKNPDYHAFLAAVLQRLARHEAAAGHYRELLQSQPDKGIWWLGLAISLERLQRSGDALVAFNNALKTGSLNDDLKLYAEEQIRRLAP